MKMWKVDREKLGAEGGETRRDRWERSRIISGKGNTYTVEKAKRWKARILVCLCTCV